MLDSSAPLPAGTLAVVGAARTLPLRRHLWPSTCIYAEGIVYTHHQQTKSEPNEGSKRCRNKCATHFYSTYVKGTSGFHSQEDLYCSPPIAKTYGDAAGNVGRL